MNRFLLLVVAALAVAIQTFAADTTMPHLTWPDCHLSHDGGFIDCSCSSFLLQTNRHSKFIEARCADPKKRDKGYDPLANHDINVKHLDWPECTLTSRDTIGCRCEVFVVTLNPKTQRHVAKCATTR
jgi:hypothetical protein